MSPRESGLTSIGSFFTRELGEPIEKARQMTAELSKTAGAAFHADVDWQAMDWQTAHSNVRRLQARIVIERLELHDGKPSRAVLRGRGGGNAALRSESTD